VNIKHPIDMRHVAVHKDPFYPEAYVISLPLDADPSYVWQTLFEQELWGSLDFWDRKVVVVGKELKLVTSKDRVQDKLNWLETVVIATNKKVEEHNRNVKGERDRKETKSMEEEAIRTELSKWMLGRVRG